MTSYIPIYFKLHLNSSYNVKPSRKGGRYWVYQTRSGGDSETSAYAPDPQLKRTAPLIACSFARPILYLSLHSIGLIFLWLALKALDLISPTVCSSLHFLSLNFCRLCIISCAWCQFYLLTIATENAFSSWLKVEFLFCVRLVSTLRTIITILISRMKHCALNRLHFIQACAVCC